jgi:hypothetical protein
MLSLERMKRMKLTKIPARPSSHQLPLRILQQRDLSLSEDRQEGKCGQSELQIMWPGVSDWNSLYDNLALLFTLC